MKYENALLLCTEKPHAQKKTVQKKDYQNTEFFIRRRRKLLSVFFIFWPPTVCLRTWIETHLTLGNVSFIVAYRKSDPTSPNLVEDYVSTMSLDNLRSFSSELDCKQMS